jgi:hypothetical protein
LVVEVINGRDKVVEELMGVRRLEKWIRGRKIREREKGGGGIFWFWGYFGLWEGKKIWGGRRRRKGNNSFSEQFCLRTLTGAHCCWEFWARGPGNRKDSWS